MNKYKKYIQHVLVFAGFMLVSVIYFFPVLEGKKLQKNDLIQFEGVNKELNEYAARGETVLWNNRQFSGLPEWKSSKSSLFYWLHTVLRLLNSYEFHFMILAFTGLYASLTGFGLKPLLAGTAGLAYAFSTFNMISLEAGHINKVFAMACMAPIVGGVVLFYLDRVKYGAMLLFLALGVQIFYNHLQITYYTLIAVLFVVAFRFFKDFKEKQLPTFFKKSAVLVVIAVLAALCNIVSLWTMWDYQKSSNRGGSELKTSSGVSEKGLAKDYVFSWSNGIGETFTLIIPYFYGGSSTEELSTNSNTYETLVKNGVNRAQAARFIKNIPLYHGDQPFTAGPVYLGASVVFLFLLGLLTLKENWLKGSILAAVLLAIVLSWGKNFQWFSDIFFYYVPLYNKFRSVTMFLSLPGALVPLFAFVGLNQLIKHATWNKELTNKILIAAGLTGGISLLVALFGRSLMDFSGPADQNMGLPPVLLDAIEADRISKLKFDAFRSFLLVAAMVGLLWLQAKGKLKGASFILCVGALVAIDLIPVNWRYLNHDDYSKQKNGNKSLFQPSAADRQILSDKGYFRVLNTTRGLTQDGITSYHHYSLGGYSAIKIQRYQELIENHIGQGNQKVLNMLNTRYIITSTDNGLQARFNNRALGNAWFVDDVIWVENANEEMERLSTFNPGNEVVIDKRFSERVKTFTKAGDGSISLTNYHPERMTYSYEKEENGLAVFSEVYYQPGWKSYVDGKETPHFRANYVLRAMVLPAGKHEVEFRFEPPSYLIGSKVEIAAGIVALLFLTFLILKIEKVKGILQ